MRRKKRIKKRKVSKSVLILSLVAGIVIIISVASYLSQQQGGFQKRTAEEYFEILDATIDYGEYREEGTALVIYAISFKIKAVEGDAHDVMVQSWARAQRYYVGEILKGETKAVMEMMSNPPFGYFSKKNEDGKFPMEIKITSMEADGYVTIYF